MWWRAITAGGFNGDDLGGEVNLGRSEPAPHDTVRIKTNKQGRVPRHLKRRCVREDDGGSTPSV